MRLKISLQKQRWIFSMLLFTVFAFQISLLNAQITLQFNQVKLVSATETVPANKVWKIENILPSGRLTVVVSGSHESYSTASTSHIIVVNGTNIYVATSDAIGSDDTYDSYSGFTAYAAVASNILNNPIWLPAGTTLAAGTSVNSISVIEFNVISP